MTLNEKEMTKINIRLTREEKNICDSEARKRGISRNAFLRDLIIEKEKETGPSLEDKIDFLVAHLGGLDNKPRA